MTMYSLVSTFSVINILEEFNKFHSLTMYLFIAFLLPHREQYHFCCVASQNGFMYALHESHLAILVASSTKWATSSVLQKPFRVQLNQDWLMIQLTNGTYFSVRSAFWMNKLMVHPNGSPALSIEVAAFMKFIHIMVRNESQEKTVSIGKASAEHTIWWKGQMRQRYGENSGIRVWESSAIIFPAHNVPFVSQYSARKFLTWKHFLFKFG